MKKYTWGFVLLISGMVQTGTGHIYAQDFVNAIEMHLTDDEIQGFREQALTSVNELSRYISIIADKSRPDFTKRKAIDLAVKLFAGETKIVEVKYAQNPVIRPKIRNYLNRLMNLPYTSVKIEWYKIYLGSEFKQGPDGRYYGTATIFQTFEGTRNKELGSYHDVTQKNIQLVIEKENYYEGVTEKEKWVLKLGDIQVQERQ